MVLEVLESQHVYVQQDIILFEAVAESVELESTTTSLGVHVNPVQLESTTVRLEALLKQHAKTANLERIQEQHVRAYVRNV